VGPELLLVALALLLAYANGANDNFKGVATLYGSGAAGYRGALAIGTAATFAGCVAAIFLAHGLLAAFSGRGLVPDAVARAPVFMQAVALAAAATVLLATRLGFPISTTHALIGSLVGAGLAIAPDAIDPGRLVAGFVVPLLTSPFVAIVAGWLLYSTLHALARRIGVTRESCVCVGERRFVPVSQLALEPSFDITVATKAECVQKYGGTMLGVFAQGIVDVLHRASAATVSFARGLNDAPKLAALLLAAQLAGVESALFSTALAMAAGGLLHARRVAEMMSHGIATMNEGQAVAANLATGALVIGASLAALPVSTTHVSVGAIAGGGIVNGTTRWASFATIALSWLLTLPIAAAIAFAAAKLL